MIMMQIVLYEDDSLLVDSDLNSWQLEELRKPPGATNFCDRDVKGFKVREAPEFFSSNVI